MKKKFIILIPSLFILSFIISAYKPEKQSSKYTERAISAINQQFQKDLMVFNQQTQLFKTVTATINSKTDYDKVLLQYRRLRESYKQVEYIIEYLDKELLDKNLNGAPLLKLEKKVAEVNILKPKGFQVVDELMVSDFSYLETETLHKTVKKLAHDVSQIVVFFKHQRITDRQFFEASRLAIIRITTLGITGFDTPETTQGLLDANAVLISLQKAFNNYKSELNSVGQIKQYKEIERLFVDGIQLAMDANFDAFDRMGFIKKITNPLYKK